MRLGDRATWGRGGTYGVAWAGTWNVRRRQWWNAQLLIRRYRQQSHEGFDCRRLNNWQSPCRVKSSKRGQQQQLEPNSVQRTQRHVCSVRELKESWTLDHWETKLRRTSVDSPSSLSWTAIESEVLQESALIDSALAARDQQVSTQLHYTLVPLLERSARRLLEHAGDGEGSLVWHSLVGEHDPTMPLEDLAQTLKGNVRSALDGFEMRVRRCGRSCNKSCPIA